MTIASSFLRYDILTTYLKKKNVCFFIDYFISTALEIKHV